MKVHNYKYDSKQNLFEFISKNNISQNQNILIQIFTGNVDLAFIKKILSEIKEIIPHAKIIGTTTCGEIIDKKVCSFSTIFSFSIFEKTEIHTFSQETLADTKKTAQALISQFDKQKQVKVAISFCDGININGEVFLDEFHIYDKNLVVSGGLAGDNATFSGTIVFNENEILQSGCVVALLYNEDLIVNTKAIFGWENIGKVLTITKANANIVYEIDGMKSVDVYAKYLGKDIANELPKTGIEFPLIIQRDGLFIPRAVVGKEDNGSLVFAGNLNEGDKVTFGYGNIDTIVDSGASTYEEVIKNPVEAIFVYSCMARKALMGESVALELTALSEITSLSGFFTYGEFFSNAHTLNNELLNQTMTLLSLSEDEKSIPNANEYVHNQHAKDKTLKAFSHLIYQTTKELEHINTSLSRRVEDAVEGNRKKDQQLLQQSRLAQMGEMISMIAHQWRQPLSAISATSASLELKSILGELDSKVIVSHAQSISKYSQHLSDTINDFRNFFKSNKEEKTTSYSAVLGDVLKIVEVSIVNKNIRIIQHLHTSVPMKTYPNELKQVILNLIKNAEDILLELKIKNAYIKITSYTDKDKEVLEISDNGGGIPNRLLDKIFDPYFSTKLDKNGTGLGLYMSKVIIEDHCHGELSVQNNTDGAVFKIILQRAIK